jgi:hypothetical protein
MDRCPPLCRPRQTLGPTIAYLLPTCDWETQIDDDMDISINSIDVSQHVMAHMEQQMPEIAKTMVSTTLAMRKQTLPSEIPPEFARYHKVSLTNRRNACPRINPGTIELNLFQEKKWAKLRFTG